MLQGISNVLRCLAWYNVIIIIIIIITIMWVSYGASPHLCSWCCTMNSQFIRFAKNKHTERCHIHLMLLKLATDCSTPSTSLSALTSIYWTVNFTLLCCYQFWGQVLCTTICSTPSLMAGCPAVQTANTWLLTVVILLQCDISCQGEVSGRFRKYAKAITLYSLLSTSTHQTQQVRQPINHQKFNNVRHLFSHWKPTKVRELVIGTSR